MHRLWSAVAVLAALLTALAACTDDTPPQTEPSSPEPTPTQTTVTPITLADVTISGASLAEREGIVLCGDRIVAGPPAGGIESDSFVVFDPVTGEGDITRVELPPELGLEPNARWLLTTRCVAEDVGEPMLLAAYQEMPLEEAGGAGIRAGYRLDGTRVWLRDNLNVPSEVHGGALVVGAAPEQPKLVVDASTGETLATFRSPVRTHRVLSTDRMVVRRGQGGPVLTEIPGRKVAALPTVGAWASTAGVLFGFDTRSVVAIDTADGEPLWRLALAADPLGEPAVDLESGVAVLVDQNYVAHGIDLQTGQALWQVPTDVASPRVTAASGLVLLDRRDEGFQLLLDARTGEPLPQPEQTLLDLTDAGALVTVEGAPQLVTIQALRYPPTPTDDASS